MNYSYIHEWARKTFGKADRCEECHVVKPAQEGKRFYCWANLSGEYKQDINDWKMMCYSCHKKYDIKRLNYVAWNKGRSSMPERICADCSKRFVVKRRGQILCSQSCVSRRGNKAMRQGLYLKKEGLL